MSKELKSRFTAMTLLRVLSCVRLFAAPLTVVCQAPLPMKFSRQEFWSGVPLPTPRDLLDPGIKPTSLASPALAGRLFATVPPVTALSLNEKTLLKRGKGSQEGSSKQRTHWRN